MPDIFGQLASRPSGYIPAASRKTPSGYTFVLCFTAVNRWRFCGQKHFQWLHNFENIKAGTLTNTFFLNPCACRVNYTNEIQGNGSKSDQAYMIAVVFDKLLH